MGFTFAFGGDRKGGKLDGEGRMGKLEIWSRQGPVFTQKRVIVRQASYIHDGCNFIAQDHRKINGLSQKGLIFGDNLTIGSHAIIRPTNIYGGDGGVRLKVGNNNSIRPYGYIGCSGYVEIGNNFLISPRVSIYSENHNFSETDVAMNKQGVTRSFFKR